MSDRQARFELEVQKDGAAVDEDMHHQSRNMLLRYRKVVWALRDWSGSEFARDVMLRGFEKLIEEDLGKLAPGSAPRESECEGC